MLVYKEFSFSFWSFLGFCAEMAQSLREKGKFFPYKDTHFVYNMSMVVKNLDSQLERLRKIIATQNGVILTSDLARANIARTYLAILEQNSEIERVSRGVYRSAVSLDDDLLHFQARYQASVYSHETALFLHELTDRTPLFHSITLPSGYHSVSLRQSDHKVFYVNRQLFDLGVLPTNTPHGNEVKATGLERTIVDVLRSRAKMDIQFIYEALRRYVRRKARNLAVLDDYAAQFHVKKIVRDYIEVLL